MQRLEYARNDLLVRGGRPLPSRSTAGLMVIAVAGTISYAKLCNGAIARSVWPVPYVYWPVIREAWVAVATILAVWSRPSWKRLLIIVGYAGATGVIRAGTVVEPATGQAWMVPARFGGDTAINLVAYLPLHVFEAIVVTALVWTSRCIGPLGRRSGVAVASSITLAIVAATAMWPTIYRRWIIDPTRASAVARADADWAAGHAAFLGEDGVDWWSDGSGVNISSGYDHATGMPMRAMVGWTDRDAIDQSAYDERVRQLQTTRGSPTWAVTFPPDAAVAAVFSSTTLAPVTSFPHVVTPGVSLTASNSIQAGNGTGLQYGSSPVTASVGALLGAPGLIAIRLDKEFVIICDRKGVIETAQR